MGAIEYTGKFVKPIKHSKKRQGNPHLLSIVFEVIGDKFYLNSTKSQMASLSDYRLATEEEIDLHKRTLKDIAMSLIRN